MDFISGKLNQAKNTVTGAVSGASAELSLERIAQALTDALEAASERTVNVLGTKGGFLDDISRHIPLPENEVGTVMTKVKSMPGLGVKVEELEVTMNRAAEESMKAALSILVGAIKALSFDDAKGILDGGDNAATAYFERTTRAPLTDAFRPIVTQRINDLGVGAIYSAIMEAYEKLPLCNAPKGFDLVEYVLKRTVAAIFSVLGGEEDKIRHTPALQSTAAMKEAFSKFTK